MHMISKKDMSDAEMDTLTKSCSPTIGLPPCVGCAIVKGDHAPDCRVAQGFVHGVIGHHGKKEEKVEEELGQEVKGQEEENAQTPVSMTMTMDEMEKTRTRP